MDVYLEILRPGDQRVVEVGPRGQEQPVPRAELPVHEYLAVLILGDKCFDPPGPLGGRLLDTERAQGSKAVLPEPDSGPEHPQL